MGEKYYYINLKNKNKNHHGPRKVFYIVLLFGHVIIM